MLHAFNVKTTQFSWEIIFGMKLNWIFYFVVLNLVNRLEPNLQIYKRIWRNVNCYECKRRTTFLYLKNCCSEFPRHHIPYCTDMCNIVRKDMSRIFFCYFAIISSSEGSNRCLNFRKWYRTLGQMKKIVNPKIGYSRIEMSQDVIYKTKWDVRVQRITQIK